MVRYSKLAFRLLCRNWGADVAFTPMIVSEDFVKSPYARWAEFSTTPNDRPLVVQFAARSPTTLATAAQYVVKYCDAVDINCGCPQKWAMKEGYGSALLSEPQKVYDMIIMTKRLTHDHPVSIKIRLSPDVRESVEMVKRAECMNVEWITVHGRTPSQKSEAPVNVEAVKLIKQNASVPIFANGQCWSLEDAQLWKGAGVDGIMSARGILQNPALFSGAPITPKKCVEEFVDLALSTGLQDIKFHNHLMFMLYNTHTNVEKKEFNNLKSVPAILSFLEDKGYNF